MASVNFDDLIPDVLPHLAADPSHPLTISILRQVARKFCSVSEIWQVSDKASVREGVAGYDFSPEPDSAVVRILSVSLSGRPLIPQSRAWLDANVESWQSTRDAPRYWYQVTPGVLLLAPVPVASINKALELTAALQPAITATGLPDWMVDRFHATLITGAQAELMLMPAKPWTDLVTGADRRDQFVNGCNEAKQYGVTSFATAPIRTAACH